MLVRCLLQYALRKVTAAAITTAVAIATGKTGATDASLQGRFLDNRPSHK
jgi:hypothetical protein